MRAGWGQAKFGGVLRRINVRIPIRNPEGGSRAGGSLPNQQP